MMKKEDNHIYQGQKVLKVIGNMTNIALIIYLYIYYGNFNLFIIIYGCNTRSRGYKRLNYY
jgi:hypothetical protein